MAHTFQYPFDVWAANGTKAAPSVTLKNTGFTGGMKPPASVFNYMWDKYGRAITELQEYTSSNFENMKSVVEAVNIVSTGWSGNIYVYSNSAITPTSPIELIPAENISATQLKALRKADIIGGTQSDGSIQLKAMGTVPTVDIPVTFIIRRDA